MPLALRDLVGFAPVLVVVGPACPEKSKSDISRRSSDAWSPASSLSSKHDSGNGSGSNN